MIKVVNFPFCNYSAVARLLKKTGCSFSDLQENELLQSDDTLILPGVGSFLQGMTYLQEKSFTELIQSHAWSGGKIVAICLGLQLLFNGSEESPGIDGLKILDGQVMKLKSLCDFSVPHIGWNSLLRTDYTPQFMNPFFDESGISMSDYYFVHSYYAVPKVKQDCIATIFHPEKELDIAFNRDQVYAFQFHPEKSGPSGYKLLSQVMKQ